ncbi:hypothetical protein TNCV_3025601 [Trichonephila clavipes]|nr:hypothetical protein TNCV_3025601 [Trichonephila clavipes]
MEPGSKAERLVLSFPATAANYPKAIDQLKERFGREDLLVQIYVRDLLTLWRAACLRKCWSPGERSRNHQTESEGSRSLEQLMNFSSARGERSGDGSFGTDRPHPPPESTKRIIMQHRADRGTSSVERQEKLNSSSTERGKGRENQRRKGLIELTGLLRERRKKLFFRLPGGSGRSVVPNSIERLFHIQEDSSGGAVGVETIYDQVGGT